MKKSAFSLIELLVVIAAIGIIVALVLPNLQGQNESIVEIQKKSNAKVMKNLYLAGREIGIEWDTTSPEALVNDLIKGQTSRSNKISLSLSGIGGDTEYLAKLVKILPSGEVQFGDD